MKRIVLFRLLRRPLSKLPNHSARLGALAFYMCLYGDWEGGKKILDSLMNSYVAYPVFFHGSTMLYFYKKMEYDKALLEANKYELPSIFWSPMLRAAVLDQLNKPEDALAHIIHIKQLKPDFEKRAGYLISNYVKETKLVDHILDGLNKAGMDIPASKRHMISRGK
jgi:hypothetical protein